MKTISLHSALTLLLLCLLSVALAHGHDEGEAMDVSGGEMGHNTTPNPSNATDSGPPSYFRHTEYSGLMLAHIVLMSVGWIFILPIGMFVQETARYFSNISNRSNALYCSIYPDFPHPIRFPCHKWIWSFTRYNLQRQHLRSVPKQCSSQAWVDVGLGYLRADFHGLDQ